MSKHTAEQYGAGYTEQADWMMPVRKARKAHECRYCEGVIASGAHYLNDLRDASYGESGDRCCIPCAIRRGYLVDRRREEVSLSESMVWVQEGVERRADNPNAEIARAIIRAFNRGGGDA